MLFEWVVGTRAPSRYKREQYRTTQKSTLALNSKFEAGTLGKCVNKVIVFCCWQAPPGIKKNLQRTYDSWAPEFISRGNSSIRAQALFVLAWFHAIMQERRNYIPQVNREKQTLNIRLYVHVYSLSFVYEISLCQFFFTSTSLCGIKPFRNLLSFLLLFLVC